MRPIFCFIASILLAAVAGALPVEKRAWKFTREDGAVEYVKGRMPKIGPEELPVKYFGHRRRLFAALPEKTQETLREGYRKAHNKALEKLYDVYGEKPGDPEVVLMKEDVRNVMMEEFERALRDSGTPVIRLELRIEEVRKALRQRTEECKLKPLADSCTREVEEMIKELQALEVEYKAAWRKLTGRVVNPPKELTSDKNDFLLAAVRPVRDAFDFIRSGAATMAQGGKHSLERMAKAVSARAGLYSPPSAPPPPPRIVAFPK